MSSKRAELVNSLMMKADVLASASSLQQYEAKAAALSKAILMLDSPSVARVVLPRVAKSLARGLSLIAMLNHQAFMQLGEVTTSISLQVVQVSECLHLLVVPSPGADDGAGGAANVQAAAILAATGDDNSIVDLISCSSIAHIAADRFLSCWYCRAFACIC